MTPSFRGFFFINKKLSRVIGLIVVRSFHFPCAAILAHIAGFRENVIALFRLRMREDLCLIGSGIMHGLRKNRAW